MHRYFNLIDFHFETTLLNYHPNPLIRDT